MIHCAPSLFFLSFLFLQDRHQRLLFKLSIIVVNGLIIRNSQFIGDCKIRNYWTATCRGKHVLIFIDSIVIFQPLCLLAFFKCQSIQITFRGFWTESFFSLHGYIILISLFMSRYILSLVNYFFSTVQVIVSSVSTESE